MQPIRALSRGLRALIDRSAADRDVDDELAHYLDRAADEYRARGLSDQEARRAAHLEIGGVAAARDQVRTSGWENNVDTALADLRYAARRLRASPAFTTATILTLALGIGATTAIWSAVNTVLFRSLPYPDAHRIVTVWDHASDGGRLETTFGTYRELAARTRTFDAMAVYRPWQPTATGPAEPERLDGQRVSVGYFRAFGIPPALGRDFTADDDRENGPKVIIVSDALWRRRFGADRSILGRAVTLNDEPHVVIGVMPPGFHSVLAPAAEVWAPLQYDMQQGRAWGHHLRMVARLRVGQSLDAGVRDIAAIAANPVSEFPRVAWASIEDGLIVSALQEDITRGVRPALLAILGAVALVLVIVCVNVTNLLLARAAQRRGEFAVRIALGASRVRLVRQLLTESLLIATLGGLLGMAVAWMAIGVIVRLGPAELPRVSAIGIDGSAFAFGLAITTVIGLAFGALPALQAVRGDPSAGLQRASRRTVGSNRRARSTLVVAEVALALLLLVSSGLLLRSISRLLDVSAGFDASGVLTLQVQTAGRRFSDVAPSVRFFTEALDAVRRVPGVTNAALTSQLPLSGDADLYGVHFDPTPTGDPGESRGTFRYAVSPGYFETMRIPLRRGRVLEDRDGANAPLVAVISESLAKRRLRGSDPIGRRLEIGDGPLYTVVGVVGDVRQMELASSDADAVYTTPAQWRFADNAMSLVVRGRGDPASLVSAVRSAVWSVDKDQPIVRISTLDALVRASAAGRHFALTLFEAFAIAALVLAATGIYGLLAGAVVERTHEIGVRSALGASRHDIVALVFAQGFRLTTIGVVLGLAATAFATKALSTLLFGISRLDPVTYVGVVALLALTAATASAIPAWRASRVSPMTAIQSD